jgi:O-antigen/teichoic acid export membrane protein
MDDRNETKRGMLWLGSATLLTRLLDVGASLAAIALLTKEDMGTAALVLSVGTVIEAVSGMGLGHALIQAKNLTDDEEQSLFWLASGIGLGLSLLMLAVSPFVASAYALPVLLPMMLVAASKLLFVGVAVVPQQLLSKHLKFREAGVVQTVCTIGEALTKLTLAALGFGAWALVLATVARGVVLVMAVLGLSGFRPRAHFVFEEVRGYLKFGVRIALSGLIYQGYRNADYFLVGRMLGVEALGVYRVAFEVGMQPLEVVLTLINRVSYPIYAKLAHDTLLLKNALLRSTRSMTLIGAPVVAFLYFAAGDVLALITHARWAEAVPAVRLLVLGSILRGNAHLFPQVYVAAGRPNYAVLDSAVSMLVLVGAFWCGLTFFPQLGMLSVCWAWIAAYPGLLRLHLALTRRITPLRTLEYLKALAPGLGGALLMVLAMVATLPLRLHEHGHVVSLLSWAVVGLGVYALYLRVALRIGLKDLAPKKQVATTT